MADISVVICTYNPDLKVLGRCLDGVSKLKRDGITTECFLIDNNSKPMIGENSIVRDFISMNPWTKLVVEMKQGLTNARICGFRSSSAPWIVFFDDDNEPDENYLQGVMDYTKRNPETGILGPGHLNVVYTEGAPAYLHKNKGWFQQYNSDVEHSGTDIEGDATAIYPPGTGMVVRREVMEKYSQMFLDGTLTIKDRNANNLGGGGDQHILWTSLTMGYAAARTPLLKLNHLIGKKKTGMDYLRKIAYYSGFSALPTLFDFFPEKAVSRRRTGLEVLKFFYRCIKIIFKNLFKPKVAYFALIWQLGYLFGVYHVNDKKPSKIFFWIRSRLGIV